MAPFPLIKLGAIFAKQISKPIANYIKNQATQSKFFREYACVRPAQMYHWIDIRIRTYALGLDSSKIAPLKEEAAVQLAADLLGEGVVVGVAILMLYLEYARRSQNEQQKYEMQALRLIRLENCIVSLLNKMDQIERMQSTEND